MSVCCASSIASKVFSEKTLQKTLSRLKAPRAHQAFKNEMAYSQTRPVLQFKSAKGARDESRSRRKLEFEDDEAFLNMDVPMEDDGMQDESNNSDDLTGDINFVHSKISNEAIPKVGMKFMTEERAYQFYNAYAYKVGFSVRRSKEHKDKREDSN
ncbi:hypothetical protein Vadar_022191 [Vaccinium darrowii]|uniref:Uncharacterized protein n=1 Tax=Vaccinium darrowii TaxID=229202 RepID=A0ACB7Y1S4_9ERIC|nr:hypothetical protein Vadar_022191 [Vaccinium darrowii]